MDDCAGYEEHGRPTMARGGGEEPAWNPARAAAPDKSVERGVDADGGGPAGGVLGGGALVFLAADWLGGESREVRTAERLTVVVRLGAD
jgi:hypothetical protein